MATAPKKNATAEAADTKLAKPAKPVPAPKAEKPAPAPKPTKVAEPKPAVSDDEKVVSGVVDRSRYDYVTTKEVKTASGRASVDNNDPLAAALRGKTCDEVIALVDANGGVVNPNWQNLNPGLARMAAGNVLRKLAKRTEGIKIDGKTLAIAVAA